MKLSLVGAAGKMGKALTSEVQQNKEFEITNYVVKPNSSLVGVDVGSVHLNEQINSLFCWTSEVRAFPIFPAAPTRLNFIT